MTLGWVKGAGDWSRNPVHSCAQCWLDPHGSAETDAPEAMPGTSLAFHTDVLVGKVGGEHAPSIAQEAHVVKPLTSCDDVCWRGHYSALGTRHQQLRVQ